MLTKLETLGRVLDDRYATDNELRFLQAYLQSARLRFLTYQKLHRLETELVQAVYQGVLRRDPHLFERGNVNLSAKWKQDTLRVLRYSATALLLDDPTWLKEKLLLWFETIMRAFGAEASCNLTYEVMQEVIQQHFTAQEVALMHPILALNQEMLGGSYWQSA